MEWEDERTPRWAVHTRLWVKPGSAWVVRSGRGKLAVGLCWPWRRSLDRFGMWRRVRREWVGEGPPIASVALRVQKARTEKRAMTAMQTHTQSCLCPGVLYIDRPERKRGNRGSPARLLSAACPHAVVNPLHLCGRLMPYRPRISGDIRTLSPPAPAIWTGFCWCFQVRVSCFPRPRNLHSSCTIACSQTRRAARSQTLKVSQTPGDEMAGRARGQARGWSGFIITWIQSRAAKREFFPIFILSQAVSGFRPLTRQHRLSILPWWPAIVSLFIIIQSNRIHQ